MSDISILPLELVAHIGKYLNLVDLERFHNTIVRHSYNTRSFIHHVFSIKYSGIVNDTYMTEDERDAAWEEIYKCDGDLLCAMKSGLVRASHVLWQDPGLTRIDTHMAFLTMVHTVGVFCNLNIPNHKEIFKEFYFATPCVITKCVPVGFVLRLEDKNIVKMVLDDPRLNFEARNDLMNRMKRQ